MIYRNDSHRGLFISTQLSMLVDEKINSAANEVAKMGVDTFESNGDEQIVDHVCSRYPLTPLSLDVDAKETQFAETKINVSGDPSRVFFGDYERFLVNGYKVAWTIPFSGSQELFFAQPSTFTLARILGEVRQGFIIFTTEVPAEINDEYKIANNLQSQLDSVQKMIKYTNRDIANYSTRLQSAVLAAAIKRREELEKIARIKKALKANINENDKAPTPLRPVAIQVNKLSPLSKSKEDPGWCIDGYQYEQILSSIRNMGSVMESSRASESRDEESLRDILLVGLNSSLMSGTAGGELFRKKGKTDISILFENKAAFVAECKLWRGEKYMLDGISQLLGYLTWRDAKTSFILFNKANQNFSSVQAKLVEILKKHQNYVRMESARDGEWRAIFTKPDDIDRAITLHVFLFDVYEETK